MGLPLETRCPCLENAGARAGEMIPNGCRTILFSKIRRADGYSPQLLANMKPPKISVLPIFTDPKYTYQLMLARPT